VNVDVGTRAEFVVVSVVVEGVVELIEEEGVGLQIA
jgi:hypothetical protein